MNILTSMTFITIGLAVAAYRWWLMTARVMPKFTSNNGMALSLSPVKKILYSRWNKPHAYLKLLLPKNKLKTMLSDAAFDTDAEMCMRAMQLCIHFFSLMAVLRIFGGKDPIMAIMELLILSACLPLGIKVFLKLKKIRLQKKYRAELPYVIDILTMCIGSGQSVEQAFEYTSHKLSGNIPIQMRKIMSLKKIGLSLEQRLNMMTRRLNITEFKNMTSSILLSKKLGTSMSNTLKIQSELMRTRKKQIAEQFSRTAAVKMSFPLVFCIFPALLIIYIAPAILQFIK